MDANTLRQQFSRDGYLLLHDFFGHDSMDLLDRAIRAHFGDDPEYRHERAFLARSKTEVIPWFPQDRDLPDYVPDRAAPFDRLEGDARLDELTGALLGCGWRPLYSMVMYSKRGTAGQAWHQDCPPEDPARYNLNRLVYTRDLTAAVGGQTVVMPGSHRRGELPPGNPHEDLPGQIVIEPRKGSLILLHGHCWHRVLPVVGGPRFSVNYRACPEGAPADITDVCVYRNMRYRFSTRTVLEERSVEPDG